MTEITGVVTTVSNPASSWLSPIMITPSSVWRSAANGWCRNGSARSVTITCPLLGRTGTSSPTIGPSRALPSPAASTTREQATSPPAPRTTKPPPLRSIESTGCSGR